MVGNVGSSTNQGKKAYDGFQSVTGTTIRNGKRLIVSMLMTTAGRTFWISAPMAGSKSTSQISPRFGAGAFAIQVILAEGFKRRQVAIRSVLLLGSGGGGLHDGIALLGRQLA
jgi:hypothetical protein